MGATNPYFTELSVFVIVSIFGGDQYNVTLTHIVCKFRKVEGHCCYQVKITLIVTELHTADKQLKKGKITNNLSIMITLSQNHLSRENYHLLSQF